MLIYNNKNQKEGFCQQMKNNHFYQAMSLDQAWDWYYTIQSLKMYNQNVEKILSLDAYNFDATMRVFTGKMELITHEVQDFFLCYEADQLHPVLIVNYCFPLG